MGIEWKNKKSQWKWPKGDSLDIQAPSVRPMQFLPLSHLGPGISKVTKSEWLRPLGRSNSSPCLLQGLRDAEARRGDLYWPDVNELARDTERWFDYHPRDENGRLVKEIGHRFNFKADHNPFHCKGGACTRKKSHIRWRSAERKGSCRETFHAYCSITRNAVWKSMSKKERKEGNQPNSKERLEEIENEIRKEAYRRAKDRHRKLMSLLEGSVFEYNLNFAEMSEGDLYPSLKRNVKNGYIFTYMASRPGMIPPSFDGIACTLNYDQEKKFYNLHPSLADKLTSIMKREKDKEVISAIAKGVVDLFNDQETQDEEAMTNNKSGPSQESRENILETRNVVASTASEEEENSSEFDPILELLGSIIEKKEAEEMKDVAEKGREEEPDEYVLKLRNSIVIATRISHFYEPKYRFRTFVPFPFIIRPKNHSQIVEIDEEVDVIAVDKEDLNQPIVVLTWPYQMENITKGHPALEAANNPGPARKPYRVITKTHLMKGNPFYENQPPAPDWNVSTYFDPHILERYKSKYPIERDEETMEMLESGERSYCQVETEVKDPNPDREKVEKMDQETQISRPVWRPFGIGENNPTDWDEWEECARARPFKRSPVFLGIYEHKEQFRPVKEYRMNFRIAKDRLRRDYFKQQQRFYTEILKATSRWFDELLKITFPSSYPFDHICSFDLEKRTAPPTADEVAWAKYFVDYMDYILPRGISTELLRDFKKPRRAECRKYVAETTVDRVVDRTLVGYFDSLPVQEVPNNDEDLLHLAVRNLQIEKEIAKDSNENVVGDEALWFQDAERSEEEREPHIPDNSWLGIRKFIVDKTKNWDPSPSTSYLGEEPQENDEILAKFKGFYISGGLDEQIKMGTAPRNIVNQWKKEQLNNTVDVVMDEEDRGGAEMKGASNGWNEKEQNCDALEEDNDDIIVIESKQVHKDNITQIENVSLGDGEDVNGLEGVSTDDNQEQILVEDSEEAIEIYEVVSQQTLETQGEVSEQVPESHEEILEATGAAPKEVLPITIEISPKESQVEIVQIEENLEEVPKQSKFTNANQEYYSLQAAPNSSRDIRETLEEDTTVMVRETRESADNLQGQRRGGPEGGLPKISAGMKKHLAAQVHHSRVSEISHSSAATMMRMLDPNIIPTTDMVRQNAGNVLITLSPNEFPNVNSKIQGVRQRPPRPPVMPIGRPKKSKLSPTQTVMAASKTVNVNSKPSTSAGEAVERQSNGKRRHPTLPQQDKAEPPRRILPVRTTLPVHGFPGGASQSSQSSVDSNETSPSSYTPRRTRHTRKEDRRPMILAQHIKYPEELQRAHPSVRTESPAPIQVEPVAEKTQEPSLADIPINIQQPPLIAELLAPIWTQENLLTPAAKESPKKRRRKKSPVQNNSPKIKKGRKSAEPDIEIDVESFVNTIIRDGLRKEEEAREREQQQWNLMFEARRSAEAEKIVSPGTSASSPRGRVTPSSTSSIISNKSQVYAKRRSYRENIGPVIVNPKASEIAASAAAQQQLITTFVPTEPPPEPVPESRVPILTPVPLAPIPEPVESIQPVERRVTRQRRSAAAQPVPTPEGIRRPIPIRPPLQQAFLDLPGPSTRRTRQTQTAVMAPPNIPAVPERRVASPETVSLTSSVEPLIDPSRASSVITTELDNRSETSSQAPSIHTEQYKNAPKKRWQHRAMMSSMETESQNSQEDVQVIIPKATTPSSSSSDIICIEDERTREEIKREAMDALDAPAPVVIQPTDLEYDGDNEIEPMVGEPLITACDFIVFDSEEFSIGYMPYAPEAVRTDALCFFDLIHNLAMGNKGTTLPAMSDRYAAFPDEIVTLIENFTPKYLPDELYQLALDNPAYLFSHACNVGSKDSMQILTREPDDELRKKQFVSSGRISDVIQRFENYRYERWLNLKEQIFKHDPGNPEIGRLEEQYNQTMNRIQLAMCDSLMGLAEESKSWEPTLNVLKRRYETFFFGWIAFIFRGYPFKLFVKMHTGRMHPRVEKVLNEWNERFDDLMAKIREFMGEGAAIRVHTLVEEASKSLGNQHIKKYWERSLLNVRKERTATHTLGCKGKCGIWFSDAECYKAHKALHDYKPFECTFEFDQIHHKLSMYLHFVYRHLKEILNGEQSLSI